MSFATSRNAGCRGNSVFGSSLARYGAQVSDRCDSRQNKTQTFSKRKQTSFSASLKHPAIMQPVCTAVSTPCHTGQGLAGHLRCVSVGNEHGKTRLFIPIRSKTTALPRCSRHLSAQRRCPCPLRRGDEYAGNRSSSPEPVRLLQTTARVDFIPGHLSLQSLYIPLQAIYITFGNEAQMRQENNVLMHCKRRRHIASHQISMRLRTSSQPQVFARPAMLNCKLSINTS